METVEISNHRETKKCAAIKPSHNSTHNPPNHGPNKNESHFKNQQKR